MNKELLELYNSKWSVFQEKITTLEKDDSLETKPAKPLLLCVDEEGIYENADIKVMIFGQETNGWCSEGEKSVDEIVQTYFDFYHTDYCFTYGGQFWNGIKRFKKLFDQKFENKKNSFLWNNIIKVGKLDDKGFPPDEIYEVEKLEFNLIKSEIEILKPDVLIFLTGPNYDSVIKDSLGDYTQTALPNSSERQLSKINVLGKENCFRTYHPNYLWRNDIDDYFQTLINEIKI